MSQLIEHNELTWCEQKKLTFFENEKVTVGMRDSRSKNLARDIQS